MAINNMSTVPIVVDSSILDDPTPEDLPWMNNLEKAVELFLRSLPPSEIESQHVARTPARFVRMLHELTKGYSEDPRRYLLEGFEEAVYDQMVIVKDMQFNSTCIHHLVPFIGVAHFGYLPDRRVVGLSKIARVLDALAHRLQIQEKLTAEMVLLFQQAVQPRGCGVVIEAEHFCICIRGVKKPGTKTETCHLAGSFLHDTIKAEFLQHIYGGR